MSSCSPDIEASHSGGLKGRGSSTTSSNGAGTSAIAASGNPSSPQLSSAVQKIHEPALGAHLGKMEKKKRPALAWCFFYMFYERGLQVSGLVGFPLCG